MIMMTSSHTTKGFSRRSNMSWESIDSTLELGAGGLRLGGGGRRPLSSSSSLGCVQQDVELFGKFLPASDLVVAGFGTATDDYTPLKASELKVTAGDVFEVAKCRAFLPEFWIVFDGPNHLLVPASKVRVDVVEDSGGSDMYGMDDIDTNMFASSSGSGGGSVPVSGGGGGTAAAEDDEDDEGPMGFEEAEYLEPVVIGPKPTSPSQSIAITQVYGSTVYDDAAVDGSGADADDTAQKRDSEEEDQLEYINQSAINKHLAAHVAVGFTIAGSGAAGEEDSRDGYINQSTVDKFKAIHAAKTKKKKNESALDKSMVMMAARMAAERGGNDGGNDGDEDGHEYINQSVIDAQTKVLPTADGGARM